MLPSTMNRNRNRSVTNPERCVNRGREIDLTERLIGMRRESLGRDVHSLTAFCISMIYSFRQNTKLCSLSLSSSPVDLLQIFASFPFAPFLLASVSQSPLPLFSYHDISFRGFVPAAYCSVCSVIIAFKSP